MGKPKDLKAATCPECGKVMSKAGLPGHMSWKHGKDPKAPLLPARQNPTTVAHAKASLWDKTMRVAELLRDNPTWSTDNAVATMSDKLGLTKQEATDELLKAKIAIAIKRDDAERKAKSDTNDEQIKRYFKAHPEKLA
jgi:hypothetical protein